MNDIDGVTHSVVNSDFARNLERRLAAATARAERFEYCEECNFPLSDCGELNPDGTPSVDCRVCQLVSKLTDLRVEVDRLRKEREERGNHILTRCPACKNDTLVINCGHLLCVWHECPDPCLIDRTDDAKLREALPDAPKQEERP